MSRFLPLLISTALIIPFSSSCHGASGAEIIAAASATTLCKFKIDDKARLLCFDTAVKTLEATLTDEPSSTATTKDMITAFAPSDYKNVDPEDVYIAPNKFKGKPIQIANMQCFYADASDYRCVAPGSQSLVIFSQDVISAEAKANLEEKCGAIKKITTPACHMTIRVVPSSFTDDYVNAMRPRVIIHADKFEVVTRAAGRR